MARINRVAGNRNLNASKRDRITRGRMAQIYRRAGGNRDWAKGRRPRDSPAARPVHRYAINVVKRQTDRTGGNVGCRGSIIHLVHRLLGGKWRGITTR